MNNAFGKESPMFQTVKAYVAIDWSGTEYRVRSTPCGASLIERIRPDESRFFAIALCQSVTEAIQAVDRMVEESYLAFGKGA